MAVSSRWAMVRVVYDGVVPTVAIGESVGNGKPEVTESEVVMMVMLLVDLDDYDDEMIVL